MDKRVLVGGGVLVVAAAYLMSRGGETPGGGGGTTWFGGGMPSGSAPTEAPTSGMPIIIPGDNIQFPAHDWSAWYEMLKQPETPAYYQPGAQSGGTDTPKKTTTPPGGYDPETFGSPGGFGGGGAGGRGGANDTGFDLIGAGVNGMSLLAGTLIPGFGLVLGAVGSAQNGATATTPLPSPYAAATNVSKKVATSSGGGSSKPSGSSYYTTNVNSDGSYTITSKSGQIVSAGSAGSAGQPLSKKEAEARARIGVK